MVLNEVGSVILSYGSSCGDNPAKLDNVVALAALLFNLGNCVGRIISPLFDKWMFVIDITITTETSANILSILSLS